MSSGGVVVWITGRPSSGKSSFAERLRMRFVHAKRPVLLLDGDAVRATMKPPVGYDEQARLDFYETLANMAARQQLLAAMQLPAAQQVKANSVFTVRFDFGSTRVAIPSDVTAALIEDAKNSPLVLLRGRTDGTTDAPAESRIARERAAAVRDYLVAAGVDPTRIRATYQPAGDHVADNASAGGRGLNRRVEIELYRALPIALSASAVTQP